MTTLSVETWIGNAAAVLCGEHGDVTAAAEQAGCSRQTVYDHAQRVQQVVEEARLPGPDRAGLLEENARLQQENQQLRQQLARAQQQDQHTILLDEQAQHHIAVETHARGLSFNQIEEIFSILFSHACKRRPDGSPPPGPDRASIARWVLRYTRQAAAVLSVLDEHTRPLARLLTPDEIFFHGKPVLVAVEPFSMTVLLCYLGPNRKGETWKKVLLPFPHLERVVADQGSGMQAAFSLLNVDRLENKRPPLDVGLDIFHIEKEARMVLARIWRKVEKAWARAEAADQRVLEAQEKQRDGRAVRGLQKRAASAWREAESYFRWHERLLTVWQRAKTALGLFRADGLLNDRVWASAQLAEVCTVLVGPSWRKVRSMLLDYRTLTFLDRLHRQLAEAVPEVALRKALVELWRLGHDCAWTVGHVAEAAVQQVICARLDPEWLAKYVRVKEVLGGVLRASSAVECVNSVLRMQQARHRNMSQGMLDLKRLYWNTRPFRAGKRKGKCPYQLLGAQLPTFDFWQLLQRDPKILAQELSTPQLAA